MNIFLQLGDIGGIVVIALLVCHSAGGVYFLVSRVQCKYNESVGWWLWGPDGDH